MTRKGDTTAAIEARTIHDPKARFKMRGIYVSDYAWEAFREAAEGAGEGTSEAARTALIEYMAARGVDVAKILAAEAEAR